LTEVSFQAMSEKEGYWRGYTAKTVTFKGQTVGYARMDRLGMELCSGGLMNEPDEAWIRQQLESCPLDELWNIADLRFDFSDDTPMHVVRHHHIERRIAAELTGYDEFCAKWYRCQPAGPVLVNGRGDVVSVDWVKKAYPGAAAYFIWAGNAPSSSTLSKVTRFELWPCFERILMAAHQDKVAVDNWLDVERELLPMAVSKHLALRREDGSGAPQ
jgi:hypothetical protein